MDRIFDILYHLYLFRFLTRSHLQTMLGHKDSHRILAWLKDLTDKGYLRRCYNPKTVTVPAIYSLGLKGRTYLKEHANDNVNIVLLDRIWREPKLSKEFQNYCLFIADCYVSLKNRCEVDGSILYFYTQTQFHGMESLINPSPSAYIAIDRKGNIKRYFLEVFRDMPPRMYLRKRVNQYVEYFEDETWQVETGKVFPKIILVAPDERSYKYLNKVVKAVEEDVDGMEINLVTRELLKEKGLKKLS